MKRISRVLDVRPWMVAAAFQTSMVTAAPPTLQWQVNVFESCIEQAILAQLRIDAASRSADAVRAACAAPRSALDAVLGSGARLALDTAVAAHIAEALAGSSTSAPAAP